MENLKCPSSRQLRVVTSPTSRVVAEVQVYPVAVEVVGSLNDIVFPERICIMLEKSILDNHIPLKHSFGVT